MDDIPAADRACFATIIDRLTVTPTRILKTCDINNLTSWKTKDFSENNYNGDSASMISEDDAKSVCWPPPVSSPPGFFSY